MELLDMLNNVRTQTHTDFFVDLYCYVAKLFHEIALTNSNDFDFLFM